MRVLLVEDDVAYAEAFLLAMDAYAPHVDVVQAHTLQVGEDTLLYGGPFDVIVLDLNLPDAKETVGVRLFVRAAPHTPIVVVTAYPQYQASCQHLGADAYLIKGNIYGEDLVRAVCRIARGDGADGSP